MSVERAGFRPSAISSGLLCGGQAETRDIALLGTSLVRRSALFPPGTGGCSLRCLLSIVLPHYVFTRLVMVVVAVKRPLLFDAGVLVS